MSIAVATCEHDEPRTGRVCRHLLESEQSYRVRFTGRGNESFLACFDCEDLEEDRVPLVDVCEDCHGRALGGDPAGFVGEPEVVHRVSTLLFDIARVSGPRTPLLELAPLVGSDRARWIGIDAAGGLYRWDMDRGELLAIAQLPPAAIDPAQPITLVVSRDGELAAVGNRRGERWFLVDLTTAAVRAFERDEYCASVSNVSLAFVERAGKQLLVYASEWNRLELIDARTGQLLSERPSTISAQGEPRNAHRLDYFHSGLTVSPDQRWIVDNGWVWHPCGIVVTWSLERWLDDNVWESEDGPSRKRLSWCDGAWDIPLCFVDDRHVAIYGLGEDESIVIASARIFDVETGREVRWFAGPRGDFVFDRYLVAIDAERGTTVWDIADGARVLDEPALRTAHYHPSAKLFVQEGRPDGYDVYRLCGHDSAAPWLSAEAAELVRVIAEERAFSDLPVLGDALEAAGCTDGELLAHCQSPGEHGERCWAIDRLRR